MTFCPVCQGPCELVELQAELAHVPRVIVDYNQLAAQKARIRAVIRRVEKSHSGSAVSVSEGKTDG